MQVVTLEIADDFIDKFKHVLDAFPPEKVLLKKDKIQEEIQQRLDDIDSGKEVLTPYTYGMDKLRDKLKSKYADS
ncbi:MAG: hypothetical protein HF962_03670 [Sulfurovum sp.]|nr:hypothetical protein [Sulfurovum sp.]